MILSKRDIFFHSKSQSTDDFFEKNNISFSEKFAEDDSELDIDNIFIIEKNDLDNEFHLSKTAVKAMRDIAYFFDRVDNNCYAKFRLLGIGALNKDEENIKTVIADFAIKNIDR